MKLPEGGSAIVEIAKLRDYCLNPNHPRGGHKARVFLSALGLRQSDAETLRTAPLQVARESDAVATQTDDYGFRYNVDFTMSNARRTALIRSAWIVLQDERIPRLTSCFVLLG